MKCTLKSGAFRGILGHFGAFGRARQRSRGRESVRDVKERLDVPRAHRRARLGSSVGLAPDTGRGSLRSYYARVDRLFGKIFRMLDLRASGTEMPMVWDGMTRKRTETAEGVGVKGIVYRWLEAGEEGPAAARWV